MGLREAHHLHVHEAGSQTTAQDVVLVEILAPLAEDDPNFRFLISKPSAYGIWASSATSAALARGAPRAGAAARIASSIPDCADSRATLSALEIARASLRPWPMNTSPFTPSSGPAPYSR